MRLPRIHSIFFSLVVFVWPTITLAFGTVGHEVVAKIAEANLTPKAKAEVQRLLTLEPDSTLAYVSTWPDRVRLPGTGPLHYVNVPRGKTCSYVPERDCPDGKCVVAAIQKQIDILSSSAPDNAKLTALKYLVHFVADIHQPLHVAYADDKGGNKFQIRYMGHGTNLHALWDSGLIDQIGNDSDSLAAELISKGTPTGTNNLDMVNAAMESCQIVQGLGFYPTHNKLQDDYINKYIPTVKVRLALAGSRLAGILNAIWPRQ